MRRENWKDVMAILVSGAVVGFIVGTMFVLGAMKFYAREVRLDRYEDGIATLELYSEALDEIEMVDVINSQPVKVIIVK